MFPKYQKNIKIKRKYGHKSEAKEEYMDYKRVIETWLRNYNDIIIKLDSYKSLYNEVEKHVRDGDALEYDKEKLSPSHKISSEVEDNAITLANMSIEINHLESKILVIQQGIKQLNEKERRIIELRFMQHNRWDKPLTWVQISREMNYDISWCRELRNRAINTLTGVMFGIQAENPLNTSRF
jgi:RinA family phage transcriptional activator